LLSFTRKIARKCKIFGIGALALSTPFLQGNVGRIDNFEQRALAAHNRERAASGIGALEWDNGLAADAAQWAAHLTKVGYLVHSESDPYDPDPQGENLWAGTAGYYSADAMVGLWIAEKKNFKPGIFPANSRTGNLEDVGHYTQLMWRSSDKVGCAIARGRSDEFMVCRYSEGGNVIGERPF
jgi:uncharacterized protein YkwD